MLRSLFYVIGSLVVSPAMAVVIPVNITHTATAGSPSVYTVSTSFTLPVGFLSPVLNIGNLYIDDRGVFELNDVIVSSTGIFGPGPGSMTFTPGGLNVPYVFAYGHGAGGGIGTQNLDVFGPFVTGLNTIDILVNDTNSGIFGAPLTTGVNISDVHFSGTVTFTDGRVAVPEPATLALLGLGIFAIGAIRRRTCSLQ